MNLNHLSVPDHWKRVTSVVRPANRKVYNQGSHVLNLYIHILHTTRRSGASFLIQKHFQGRTWDSEHHFPLLNGERHIVSIDSKNETTTFSEGLVVSCAYTKIRGVPWWGYWNSGESIKLHPIWVVSGEKSSLMSLRVRFHEVAWDLAIGVEEDESTMPTRSGSLPSPPPLPFATELPDFFLRCRCSSSFTNTGWNWTIKTMISENWRNKRISNCCSAHLWWHKLAPTTNYKPGKLSIWHFFWFVPSSQWTDCSLQACTQWVDPSVHTHVSPQLAERTW